MPHLKLPDIESKKRFTEYFRKLVIESRYVLYIRESLVTHEYHLKAKQDRKHIKL